MRRLVLTQVVPLLVWGADVTGTWRGETTGRDGRTREIVLDLKADGSRLSGTMRGPMGREFPISDGRVEGDQVRFVVVFDSGGNDVKLHYTGKLEGDELQMKSQREGTPRVNEFTVKRARR